MTTTRVWALMVVLLMVLFTVKMVTNEKFREDFAGFCLCQLR